MSSGRTDDTAHSSYHTSTDIPGKGHLIFPHNNHLIKYDKDFIERALWEYDQVKQRVASIFERKYVLEDDHVSQSPPYSGSDKRVDASG